MPMFRIEPKKIAALRSAKVAKHIAMGLLCLLAAF
jgi:hypothetical protein